MVARFKSFRFTQKNKSFKPRYSTFEGYKKKVGHIGT